jgi:hypothetical protein
VLVSQPALKNIVRFTDLEIGVPVALPHFLGFDNDAPNRIPDLVIPKKPGFTVTADDTNVTVTRNFGSEADVDVYVEFWKSSERKFPEPPQAGTAGQGFLEPNPCVLDMSALQSAPSTIITWHPGVSDPANNIYPTFSEAHAAAQQVRGPVTIYISSFGSNPAVIDAGTYSMITDFASIKLDGFGTVRYEDGAVITDIFDLEIVSDLGISFRSDGNSQSLFVPSFGFGFIYLGAAINEMFTTQAGDAPVIDFSDSFFILATEAASGFGFSSTPFAEPVVYGDDAFMILFPRSGIRAAPNWLGGDAGVAMNFINTGGFNFAFGSRFSTDNPNHTGTVDWNPGNNPLHVFRDQDADFDLAYNDFARIDTAGGAVTATLPTAQIRSGERVRVKRRGANGLTVAVQSGEDLNGTTDGTAAIGDETCALFVSDGLGGWEQC